jgi:2-amino-4-hydroxy-6-hydroxymethyldihydropteridine diphosphokinase
MPIIAYLGLGANLGDPRAQIERAIAMLADDPTTRVLARAQIYQTPPLGPPGQPEYTNTAVKIETSLSPHELLRRLKNIEQTLGRVPAVRWGPRAIDVDILIYGELVLDEELLVIPHRELANRRFVLEPLADLAPGVVVPRLGKTVRDLLESLPS